MKGVRIIVTGGTIDKVHDTRTEGLGFAPDGATHIPEIVSTRRKMCVLVAHLQTYFT